MWIKQLLFWTLLSVLYLFTISDTNAQESYYTYKNGGGWHVQTTWTKDATGLTLDPPGGAGTPPASATVVIKPTTNPVFLDANVSEQNLDLTVEAGASLDLKDKVFDDGVFALRGKGHLLIASNVFPRIGAYMPFLEKNGGTVTFNFPTTAPVNIKNFPKEVWNLEFAAKGQYAYQLRVGQELKVLNHLSVIDDAQLLLGGIPNEPEVGGVSFTRKKIQVGGNLTIGASASLSVISGSLEQASPTQDPLSYYESSTHILELQGSLVNGGKVTLHDLPNLDFARTSVTTHNVTLVASGAANATFECNGQTDLYALVVNKGTNTTTTLTISAAARDKFRLWGGNSQDGKKALFLRSGTLIFAGKTAIASLSEKDTFVIADKTALVLDGTDVLVVQKAQNAKQVADVWGVNLSQVQGVNIPVNANDGAKLEIGGQLHVKNGTFAVGDGAVIATGKNSPGELLISNGQLFAPQIYSGDMSLAFHQKGGLVVLRGQREDKDVENYNSTVNPNRTYGASYSATPNFDKNHGAIGLGKGTDAYIHEAGEFRVVGASENGHYNLLIDLLVDEDNSSHVRAGKEVIDLTGLSLTPAASAPAGFVSLSSKAHFGNFEVILNTDDQQLLLKRQLTVEGNMHHKKGVLALEKYELEVQKNFQLDGTLDVKTAFLKFVISADQHFTVAPTARIEGNYFNRLEITAKKEEDKCKLRFVAPLDYSFNELRVFRYTELSIANSDKRLFVKQELNVAGNATVSGGEVVLDGMGVLGGGWGHLEHLTVSENSRAVLKSTLRIKKTLTLSQNSVLNINQVELQIVEGGKIETLGDGTGRIETNGRYTDKGVRISFNATNGTEDFVIPFAYMEGTQLIDRRMTIKGQKSGYIYFRYVNRLHPMLRNGYPYYLRVTYNNGIHINDNVTVTMKNTEPVLPATYKALYLKGNQWEDLPIPPTSSTLVFTLPKVSNKVYSYDCVVGEKYNIISYVSVQDGNWNDATTWTPQGVPLKGDLVEVKHNVHVAPLAPSYLDNSFGCGALVIASTGKLDVPDISLASLARISGHGTLRLCLEPDHPERNRFSDMPEISAFITEEKISGVKDYGTVEFYMKQPDKEVQLPEQLNTFGHLTCSYEQAGQTFVMSAAVRNLYVNGRLFLNNPDANPNAIFSIGGVKSTYSQERKLVVGKKVDVDNVFISISKADKVHSFWFSDDVHFRGSSRIVYTGTSPKVHCVANVYFYRDLYNDTDGELNFAEKNLYSRVFYVNTTPARIMGRHPILFMEFRVKMRSGAKSELSIDNIGGIRASVAVSSLEWFFIDNPGTVHVNSAFDFHITAKQTFTLRAGVTLHANNDNLNIRIATDCEKDRGLLLLGKINLEKGKVFIGSDGLSSNRSADIEYPAYSNASIEVQSGELTVYGAIRRTYGNDFGRLDYIQTGGKVTIAPTAKNVGRRRIEIYGDKFTMSGGELIYTGAGGILPKGDVFISAVNSSVTGGMVRLTGGGSNKKVYLSSVVNLYNLSCEGVNQEVHVFDYPLDIKGTTSIASTSKLFTDDVDISFAGNVNCDGEFQARGYKTTRFYEGAQRIYGGATKFTAHHLVVESNNGLTYELPVDASLGGNLTIEKRSASAEHLDLKNRHFILTGNLFNHGGYKTAGGALQLVGTERSELTGNGHYGTIEVNKSVGAVAKNDVHLYGDLVLAQGNFYLDRHLLHIQRSGKIDQHATSHYIVTDGSFVSKGIRQDLGMGMKKVSFPIGTASAYTPVELTIVEPEIPDNSGFIRVLNVASSFDVVGDCRDKVLRYHWEVESQFSPATGELKFSCPTSFKGANMILDESAPLRFISGAWTQQTKRQLDEQGSTFIQRWMFNNTTSLSGRYTSGAPLCVLNIREVETVASGTWENNAWKLYGAGTSVDLPDGPNGLTVHINPEHTITIQNKADAKKIVFENPAPSQPEGVLVVENTATISSLGSLHGRGALQVYKGTLPAADYTDFFGCTHEGKLVLAGNGNYNLDAKDNNEYPYLHLIGTGKRIMPNADLTVCKELKIRENTVYDNSVHNKGLLLLGTIDREATASFIAGTGDNAWVWFKGTTPQALGGAGVAFEATNKLNKLIIENEKGVTVRDGGTVEVADLRLKKGVLHTPRSASGKLLQTPTQTNTAAPDPERIGSIQSYIDGPLWVKIPAGVTSYCFPLGVGTSLANQMILSELTPGDIYVEVVANPTAANVQSPLTLVDRKLWKVAGKAAATAKVSFLRGGFDWATGKTDAELSVAKKGALKWEEVLSEAVGGGLGNEIRTTSTESILLYPAFVAYSFGTKSAVPPTLSYDNLGGRYCVPVDGQVIVPVKIVASGEWSDYLPMLIRYKAGNNIRTFEVGTSSLATDVFDLPIKSTDDPATPPVLSESITFQVLNLTYRHNTTPGNGQVDETTLTAYRIPKVTPGAYNMCFNKGSAVNLLGSSTPVGTPTWLNDDGVGTFIPPNAYQTRFTLSATAPMLVLKLKVDNHGCIGEANALLTQVQPPAGTIVGKERVCLLDGNPLEEAYTFSPTSVANPITYAWSLENKPNSLTDLDIVAGTQSTNPTKVNWVATPPYHGAQKYGATLRLKVVDKNQCLSTFELPVQVILDYRTAPVYFTPYNN